MDLPVEQLQDVNPIVMESPVANRQAMADLTNIAAAIESNGDGSQIDTPKITQLRPDAIYNASRNYATQMALHWRTESIMALIDQKYAGQLDAISFRPLIEQGYILVPSVVETKSAEHFENNQLTQVRASYTIDQEARLVVHPPTFRDYLTFSYPAPRKVHSILMPKNAQETARWEEGARIGWQLGMEQADEIVADGINRFVKDIVGRVTYFKLVSLNMIKPTSLASVEALQTFNGRTMNVGEEILFIDDVAQYQSINDWRAPFVLEAVASD